jgi:hypothetical protein
VAKLLILGSSIRFFRKILKGLRKPFACHWPNRARIDLVPAIVQLDHKQFNDQFIRQSSTETKTGLTIEDVTITKKGKKITPGRHPVLLRSGMDRLFEHYGLNQITKYTFPQK